MSRISAVILAAGQGTRMKSDLPKVLHRVAGRPMILNLLATVDELKADKAVVVVGPGMDNVAAAVAPHPTAVQTKQQGTGDAVKAARAELEGFKGSVLVLYGDTPLIKKETLQEMIRRREEGASVVVLGFRPKDPARYGRLVTDESGLKEIVEFKDATEEQRKITLCNSGVMCIDGEKLFGWLDRLKNNNAAGEFYLTDVVALARQDGFFVAVVEGDAEEVAGVNSRTDLAFIEKIAQKRLREKFMAQGVTLIDPETVYFSYDTVLGRDVVIEPSVFFGAGMTVGNNVEIRAFSHLEGASVHDGAKIGPFARLRPGAEVGEDCHIGNFVEIKNASVEKGAKVNHLSYIGDARIGTKTNIGAGTITCNYDGYFKSRTDIGAGAFIGSNTALVAPVTVGDGAMVAAGSTVTKNIPADALAVARGKQTVFDGWAERFRAQKHERKSKLSK
ncbi:MAG: bifunctional UDP-N-acetylglucosamine diphosphorylase/glucosamine-1-phosphate N-acetyltransferase GlmU [Alphaproteobacteria bacterium]